MNHGDFRAEAAKHLRELEPHVPSAYDHQALRNPIELHDGGVGHVGNLGEAGDVGNLRPGAGIDEDERRGETKLSFVAGRDPNLARGSEARLSENQIRGSPAPRARAGSLR